MRPLQAAVCLIAASAAAPAWADVVTDGTAGPRVRLGGDFEIGADLGTRAGRNLFHSFERFSLDAGERATFSGPDQIRNVISRVTGGARSDIDGTIRSTIPGADFYFLNPGGVVFGPNASLDLPGSFHVSTADELRFADGAKFSAADPTASSFTVAAPEAFGFLSNDPASILANGSSLQVDELETFSIVGGEIAILGGGATDAGARSGIGTENGDINLLALGGPGHARVAKGHVSLSADETANITLANQALLDVGGDGGGTVRIRGGVLELVDSEIVGDNLGAADAQGTIDIRTDSLSLNRGSRIALDARGSGDAGDTKIMADTVTITENSVIASAAFAAGDAGDIVIRAQDLSIFGTIGSDNPAGIINSGQRNSRGAAGKTAVRARDIVIRDDGRISSDAFGNGPAGDVSVSARSIELQDGGQISAITFTDAPGGNVNIDADRVEVTGNRGSDFTTIAASSIARGPAGTVTVNARESLALGGGGSIQSLTVDGPGGAVQIRAGRLLVTGPPVEDFIGTTGITTVSGGDGNAGPIEVVADTVTIEEEGAIRATALAGGDAGVVSVRATNIAVLSGGEISSDSETDASGAAGLVVVAARDTLRLDGAGARSITRIGTDTLNGASGPRLFQVGDQLFVFDAGTVIISADTMQLTDGGVVRSATFGAAVAGTIAIFARELDAARGSSAPFTGVTTTATTFGSRGRAGEVRLFVGEIRLRDGAAITSDSFGQRAGGSIVIEDAHEIVLDGGAEISTSTAFSGGGDIRIEARDLILLRDQSRIGVDVLLGEATAGNIRIDPTFLVLDESVIGARADGGAGGQINIKAGNLILSPGSQITARAGPAGIDGMVVISSPEVDLSGGLVVLEGALLDAASQLRERCGARRDIGASSFTGVGRGGLPASPDAPLSGSYLGAAPTRTDGAGVAATVAASFDRPVLVAAPCLGLP